MNEKTRHLQDVNRRRREAGEIVVRRNPVEKLRLKPQSKALAIAAMCFQCQGEDADSSVRWRIANCEISNCALFTVRPYRAMEGREIPEGLKT